MQTLPGMSHCGHVCTKCQLIHWNAALNGQSYGLQGWIKLHSGWRVPRLGFMAEQHLGIIFSSPFGTDCSRSSSMPPEIHRNLVTDNQRRTLHTVCPDLLNSPEIWDTQWVGIQVFKAEMLMQGKDGMLQFSSYISRGLSYSRAHAWEKGIRDIQKTPGGLLYRQEWSNTQSMLRIP